MLNREIFWLFELLIHLLGNGLLIGTTYLLFIGCLAYGQLIPLVTMYLAGRLLDKLVAGMDS